MRAQVYLDKHFGLTHGLDHLTYVGARFVQKH